jgi:membrane-associated phospholipid phosphatase
MLKKIAAIISVTGHPLLLGSLVIVFQTYYAYSARQSMMDSVIVIGGITLPVIIWNFYKTYSGKYTGFDIPLRLQRRSFYRFLSCCFALVTIILLATGQPYRVSIAVFFCLLMVSSCFLINYRLKVSLHSATSFYLAFVLFSYNREFGDAMLGLAVLVAISGKILHLHTISEILAGTAMGMVFGSGYLLVLHFLQ